MNSPVAKSDLTPFWDVDIDSDPRKVEAAALLNKMDSEGGLHGYLGWGGVDAFPDALRDEAQAFADAEYALSEAIGHWAADRGVST